ncbi:hypothetical protein G6011_09321 [Alternaria panax]|uniref:Uncharacterized protein n=1 Tax=Alternaria panax TaxID=48097 RepID=A0AAD4IB29_9PLEO|nr:hypothetical protein G6011_09321 [Alternaria panax]
MSGFLSSIITMLFFVGAVFSAVVPSAASAVVSSSAVVSATSSTTVFGPLVFSPIVVPTFVPRSDAFCVSRGNSTAPEPSSDSLSGFTEDTKYGHLALSAPIPTGYALAMNNANCAFSSNRYMLYVQLDSYSPETCAELCNGHGGCDSFNIYIQRDPSVVPGPACPNPAPIAVTKCALYSEPEEISSCTNFGQHVGPVDVNGEAFKVAIRGSNAYNKVFSVNEVFVTITKTKTVLAGCQNERRGKTSFVEPSSGEYDATTTVRKHKSTPVYVGPETVDTPAGTVTVTSYNDYYVGTTTITSGDPDSTTTVTVTGSGIDTVFIPGSVVTITSKSPDTTTTVFAAQQIEPSAVASTVTVTLLGTATITNPASTVTITSTGADTTSTVYDKRDIAAAAKFKGKAAGSGRWNAWTKTWIPAPHCCDSTTTVSRFVTGARPHHVLPSYLPRSVGSIVDEPEIRSVPNAARGIAKDGDVHVFTTPSTISAGRSTHTRTLASPTTTVTTKQVVEVLEPITIEPGTYTESRKTVSRPAGATETDVVYVFKDTSTPSAPSAPMKTVTLDDSYTYTGPTNVPMKTITLRAW